MKVKLKFPRVIDAKYTGNCYGEKYVFCYKKKAARKGLPLWSSRKPFECFQKATKIHPDDACWRLNGLTGITKNNFSKCCFK